MPRRGLGWGGPWLAAGVLCLLAGCAGARDPGLDAGLPDADGGGGEPFEFTLLTWNVHDLFDPYDDPSSFDDVPSVGQVDEKLRVLGRVIASANADVVLLQEVENLPILERLADGPLAGMGYTERVLVEAGEPRGIDVALLSRLPVERVASHAEERFASLDGSRTYTFARDALEVFVSAGGVEIDLVVLHLRSMLGGADAEAHRQAEAQQVRRIVEARLGAGVERIIVAGDINDVPGSATYALLLENGALSEITDVLPASERWTTNFGGTPRFFDYIFGSALAESAAIPETVEVLRGAEVTAASDHWPVFARFRIAH
ncbi:MAG: endonuclease/exonuclease/phosphatase family protein [Myxococcales bacterium]|nr:endonuclease/exonuclease/phosphatase family protein [Myxococcales bacterium]